jgi:hypothetical protein
MLLLVETFSKVVLTEKQGNILLNSFRGDTKIKLVKSYNILD